MWLASEVIEQVQARFKPTSFEIKKRVESLIAQEYLRCDENERSQYKHTSPKHQVSLILLLSLCGKSPSSPFFLINCRV
jgi:hypothetical protein